MTSTNNNSNNTNNNKRQRPSNDNIDNPDGTNDDDSTLIKPDSNLILTSYPTRLGQWRCLIYIPIQISSISYNILTRFIHDQTNNNEKLDINTLHISLSRVFSLYRHEIDAVKSELITSLQDVNVQFNLTLSSLKFVQLENSTSDLDTTNNNVQFLGVCIQDGLSELNDIVDCIDQVLVEFGKEPYYKPRIFHVSIGVRNKLENDHDKPFLPPIIHATTTTSSMSQTTIPTTHQDEIQTMNDDVMYWTDTSPVDFPTLVHCGNIHHPIIMKAGHLMYNLV
jgi:hypothetical protein